MAAPFLFNLENTKPSICTPRLYNEITNEMEPEIVIWRSANQGLDSRKFSIEKDGSTEKRCLTRSVGVYVGVRATHAPPHIPLFLSFKEFFQWTQRITS